MKFILISRHTGGSEIPESAMEQNMKEMGEWIGLLKATVAMPIRGGKSVTAKEVAEYSGDAGGLIIFGAENLDQAIGLVKKSPGLKYGFTHELFPEISMESASKKRK